MDTVYRYDLHVHTTEGSACAHNTAAEMTEMYARAGYAGFVVTDHFYRGHHRDDHRHRRHDRLHYY